MAKPAIEVRLENCIKRAQVALEAARKYRDTTQPATTKLDLRTSPWTPAEEQALADTLQAAVLLKQDACDVVDAVSFDYTECITSGT